MIILQFRENLSDRQAAEAVRARIDWKYLLGLELTDEGFTHSVPKIEALQIVLERHYEYKVDAPDTPDTPRVRWKSKKELPPY